MEKEYKRNHIMSIKYLLIFRKRSFHVCHRALNVKDLFIVIAYRMLF